MEINIELYPILRDDDKVKHWLLKIDQAKDMLEKAVTSAQSECSHPKFVPIHENNLHIGMHDYYGKEMYTGKKCNECGVFLPRKSGRPWEICYACGEGMRLFSPEHADDKMYKCIICPNTAWRRVI